MSTPNQTAGRKRLVHQLDTPFSTTPWPEISADDQDAILELLCSFLSPIGQHRRSHVKRSKGKRAARKGKKAAAAAAELSESSEPAASDAAVRAVQEQLSSSIDIGFNSITRTLQSQSATTSRPPQEPSTARSQHADEEDETSGAYSMVFVARGNQSSAFNCHFPQMIGAASLAQPADQKLRLVGFSKPCSDRLGGALGLPRVSSVAVKCSAPGADALLAFVRRKVGPVSVPWMEGEGRRLDYRTTQIKSTETTVGAKRVKQA